MWNKLFRNRDKEVRLSTAEVFDERTYVMVRQIVLPLVPQRRVKGALEYASRETGVSYSKLRKIFYRLGACVRAFEYDNISDALKRAAIRQERLYRDEAERLASLIAEREAWERQHSLDLGLDRLPLEAVDSESRPGP